MNFRIKEDAPIWTFDDGEYSRKPVKEMFGKKLKLIGFTTDGSHILEYQLNNKYLVETVDIKYIEFWNENEKWENGKWTLNVNDDRNKVAKEGMKFVVYSDGQTNTFVVYRVSSTELKIFETGDYNRYTDINCIGKTLGEILLFTECFKDFVKIEVI